VIVLALERSFPSPHPGQASPGLVIAGQWRAASGAAGGGWPPAGPHWPGAPGQPPRVGERTAEQELDLGVGAAQLVAGPSGEGVVDGGSSRSRTLLRSVTAVPWLPSLVEGAGVDDRLGGPLPGDYGLVKMPRAPAHIEAMSVGWRFSHAVVYVGHGQLVEAWFDCVRERTVAEYPAQDISWFGVRSAPDGGQVPQSRA
jgi:hypothetical protein